jgi:hypothetical protein
MSLKFSDVVAYPYRSDNLVTMVVVPGVVAIVDAILMLIVMLIVIAVVFAILLGMGVSMGSLLSAVPNLFHQSATWIAKMQVGFLPTQVLQVVSDKLHLFARHLDGVLTQGWHYLNHDGFGSHSVGDDWGGLFSVEADPSGDTGFGDSGSAHHDYSSGGGSPSGSGNFHASNGPLYAAYWFGLEWALYKRWKTQGVDAPPPSPIKGRYFLNGLKGFLFYGPVNLLIVCFHLLMILCLLMLLFSSLAIPFSFAAFPDLFGALESRMAIGSMAGLGLFFIVLSVYVILSVFGSFFLSPFLIAPMMISCEERTVKSMYDFPKAIQITVEHYPRVLLSFLMIGVMSILYLMASFALCCTCVGLLLFPFIWNGAYRVSAALLLAEGFGLLDEKPAAPGEPIPVSV